MVVLDTNVVSELMLESPRTERGKRPVLEKSVGKR